jgi:hypothetical protein
MAEAHHRRPSVFAKPHPKSRLARLLKLYPLVRLALLHGVSMAHAGGFEEHLADMLLSAGLSHRTIDEPNRAAEFIIRSAEDKFRNRIRELAAPICPPHDRPETQTAHAIVAAVHRVRGGGLTETGEFLSEGIPTKDARQSRITRCNVHYALAASDKALGRHIAKTGGGKENAAAFKGIEEFLIRAVIDLDDEMRRRNAPEIPSKEELAEWLASRKGFARVLGHFADVLRQARDETAGPFEESALSLNA